MMDFVQSRRARFLCGTMIAAGIMAGQPAMAQVTPPAAAPTQSGPQQAPLPQTSDDGAVGADTQTDTATDSTSGQDIVVTGSRIARSGFDASTPVNVVNADDIKLSGNVNVEKTLAQIPQAVGSALGSATSNTVPGGFADVNLRGFGSQRNLVLVNGRRFAIFGPEQVTDLNTIPSTLVERTEVVTGGSSAVYGSDAITGVVNFIIRDDFEGFEARGQVNMDGPTGTPVYNADLTLGGNFADGRGNVVVSGNYLKRGSITRGQRGGYAFDSLVDGCVTPGSGSDSRAGTPFPATTAVSGCVAAGGELGFVAGGSGDIPNGRFSGVPTFAAASPALQAAYASAGLSGLGGRGFTFNNGGTAVRPAVTPQDDFNLGPFNYLIQPQERWMINSFGHYDFSDAITGYMELHYSNNVVDAQLAPTNVGASTLFNVNNPYLTPALQQVLRTLDAAEVGTTTVTSGSASRTTVANDGLAVVTAGRRYVENGARFASDRRNVFRGVWGLRGSIGSVSENILTDLKYDAYYSYARSEDTLQLRNAISRSRLQSALLSVGGAAPVCNIFGANVSAACVSAISIGALNTTIASQQVGQISVTGTLFPLPAGPVGFSYGYEWRKASASYTPDTFLASGDVVGFNPGLPTRGSTTAKEVFGEIRVPLIHDTPFIDSLIANGGFRYSKYNLTGIGGVWTYLGGLDWRVNRDVAFRGQYQRAIRAPSVAELFGGTSRQIVTAIDPCSNRIAAAQQTQTVRQLCVATGVPASAVFTAAVQPNAFFSADTGGNRNLRAEVSDTYTAGIVLTPRMLPGLYASVDYFNIALKGAVSQLGGGLQGTLNLCYLTVQNASSEFCQAVQRSPQTGEINEPFAVQVRNANSGVLKTSGLDFAVRYRIPLNFGLPGFGESSKIDLSTAYTWLAEFNNTPVAALPNVIYKCAASYGPTCGQPLPRWRGTTRATWTSGDLGLSVRHRYIGPVTTDRFVVPLRQGAATTPLLSTIVYPKLPSRNYIDLSFTYDIADGMQIFGGANNVFDTDPPITTQGPNANTFSATYDVVGTEFFLGATLKF